MEETGQKVEVHYQDGHIRLEGYVADIAQLSQIEAITAREEPYPISNYLSIPQKYLIDTEITELKNTLLILDKSSKERDNLLLLENQVLNVELAETIKVLHKIKQNINEEVESFAKQSTSIKNKMASSLEKVFSQSTFYQETSYSLSFESLNLFVGGKAKYEAKAMKIIQRNFNKYIEVLEAYSPYIESIIIEGHADSRGDELANMTLSKQRALAVRRILLQSPTLKFYNMQGLLDIEVLGSHEVISKDGIEDPIASRRIEIHFELKSNKALDKLKKIIRE
ncbi:MAG: OmpA family protein [Sulfurovum sp.]|nr:OmpA family protein [Sulfurovum sp.]